MEVTPLPIVTLVMLVHSLKTLLAMVMTLSGIVTLVRPVQPLKAPPPIVVTLSGIVMLVRLVQPLNDSLPIEVTLLPIVTLVRPVQSWKACSPIDVTPLPMIYSVTCVPNMSFKLEDDVYVADTIVLLSNVTLVRLVQPLKQFSPIVVTPLPIVMFARLLQ